MAYTRRVLPKKKTGQLRKSGESPWWDSVALSISELHHGKELTIEQIYELVPNYPNGFRPKIRTASRRLKKILELLERGPNGSRSVQAVYKILPMRKQIVAEEPIMHDEEWIKSAINAMIAKKK